jgi:hypothetical protein
LLSGKTAGLKAMFTARPLIYPQLTGSIPYIVVVARRFFKFDRDACPAGRLVLRDGPLALQMRLEFE